MAKRNLETRKFQQSKYYKETLKKEIWKMEYEMRKR